MAGRARRDPSCAHTLCAIRAISGICPQRAFGQFQEPARSILPAACGLLRSGISARSVVRADQGRLRWLQKFGLRQHLMGSARS
eukprot:9857287-Alexandrium_andersonii.AAC.1